MQKDPKSIYAEIIKLEAQLEEQLGDYFDALRNKFNYTIQNGKVRFDKAISKANKRYKVSLFYYIIHAKLSHLLMAPLIYAMIVPITFFDLTLSIYQHICFRAYGIPLVSRKDYFIIDRHLLSYLNTLEKINCLYCSYGNGTVSYGREILARTEQYWCPIKHAQHPVNTHGRYRNFAEFGDAESYRAHLAVMRKDFIQKDKQKPE